MKLHYRIQTHIFLKVGKYSRESGKVGVSPPVHDVPPTASQTQISTESLSTLGHGMGMVIASLNANSLPLHIDEMRTLVKEL